MKRTHASDNCTTIASRTAFLLVYKLMLSLDLLERRGSLLLRPTFSAGQFGNLMSRFGAAGRPQLRYLPRLPGTGAERDALERLSRGLRVGLLGQARQAASDQDSATQEKYSYSIRHFHYAVTGAGQR